MLPSAAMALSALLPSLERLCSMKRVLSLTDHQAETWVAVLGQFPSHVVNRAILEIGLSSDPFPDLGKLVLCCQRHGRDASVYAPLRDETKVAARIIHEAAKALQLPIEPERANQ